MGVQSIAHQTREPTLSVVRLTSETKTLRVWGGLATGSALMHAFRGHGRWVRLSAGAEDPVSPSSVLTERLVC